MNLAWLVTPEQSVPPPMYGGAECVTDIHVRHLIRMGHTVDLYCGPNSSCPATNVIEARKPSMTEEDYLVNRIEENWKDYDCIIDYSAYHIAGQKFPNALSLMGGDPFKKYPHDKVRNRVYKSKEFGRHYDCGNHPVLHNVIEYDPETVKVGPGGDYVLFVGIIHRCKGIHLAGKVCKKLGRDFVVAGPIRDETYWEDIKDCVTEYVGEVGYAEKDELMSNAYAFAHPVQCCDCDPLGPKEAMLRGTPVIACPSGGVSESVTPGVSGYFAVNAKQFENGFESVFTLNRELVRQDILAKIDPILITDTLVDLCRRVKEGISW